MKKIAVIGGGIFGATAAIFAARAGHEVHLFEKNGQLLSAASGINQYRLHRGYHYPRSADTARSALEAEQSFLEEYGDSVISGGTHLYAIAKEGSAVSEAEFLAFCDAQGLSYTKVDSGLVDAARVGLVIEGVETRFDPDALRGIVARKLAEAGVQVHLNTPAESSLRDSFDKIIIAAYAQTNAVAALFTDSLREYQFEVCEKPVVTLPDSFGLTDLVVMDGPFMCVDPLGTSGKYVLGNVVHAIHASNVGFYPELPAHLAPLLDTGIVESPHSKFDTFVEHGSAYIPALKEAKHVGSMYTVRTVLPRLEKTDARPTLVESLDDTCIKIFSGKIGNCVEAAKKAVSLLE